MTKKKTSLLILLLVMSSFLTFGQNTPPDTTKKQCETPKGKKVKITDQMIFDRLAELEVALTDLQAILVNGEEISDMSPYVLRSEHIATVDSLSEMQITLQVKEIEFQNEKKKLNDQSTVEKTKRTKLTEEKKILGDQYSKKQKEVGELNTQITNSKKAFDKERKANEKITNDLVVAFLKQETVDIATVQKMIELDRTLNSSKHFSDLTDYKGIQELISQGREILTKALNKTEIAKYNDNIQGLSALKSTYPKPLNRLAEIAAEIDEYINVTCNIQHKVNVIVGSKLNAEQKKDRLATRVVKEDQLENIKSRFPYLYREIEHTKKTLQWRIVFQCD